jgi:hypothetical protein
MTMNQALWIVAGLLAAAFFAGGIAKLVIPKERFPTVPSTGWANDFSAGAFRALGALEVLAALGLILPAVTGIAPVLVPLAALGLVAYMGGATATRLRRREYGIMLGDLVFLALAAFVAWGRFSLVPFPD